MLESLHIRNLAVVGDANIEFGPGFNVLTGETGAGKSLILSAFQLLLGERAGPHLIRTGEDHSELTAVVSPSGLSAEVAVGIREILENAGIPETDSGDLLLRRVLSQSGSRAFVNSVPTTSTILRKLGELLVDIHGPHDHQSLLRSSCQLGLLDRFAGLMSEVRACGEAWGRVCDCREALEQARNSRPSPERVCLLRHQVAEIDAAEISIETDERLFKRYQAAANARRLLEIAGQVRQVLDDSDDAAAEQLAMALRLLGEARELDPDGMTPLCEQLAEVVTSVRELSIEMDRYAGTLEIDSAELARMEERLELLHRLKRKYGASLVGVLAQADVFRRELAELEDRGAVEARLQHELEQAEKDYAAICTGLSRRRRTAGEELGAAITAKLARLAFGRARFEVSVRDAEAGSHGADRVEFLFSPASGAPLLPLRRIASTGEIARIMLAVKTVLCAADQVPILVFDEVDANVGGRVAVVVGEELRTVATRHQVLCITHLPQIAATADRHFLVHRADDDSGAQSTRLALLATEARLGEIARMLGAPDDSRTARAHARELLRQANRAARTAAAE
ncbi:MAG: DNA repair protein RecN [Kiritimatiellaeota bacterium]|nr:DNA repair protein RecN [Kiritimatiellota bacterium]